MFWWESAGLDGETSRPAGRLRRSCGLHVSPPGHLSEMDRCPFLNWHLVASSTDRDGCREVLLCKKNCVGVIANGQGHTPWWSQGDSRERWGQPLSGLEHWLAHGGPMVSGIPVFKGKHESLPQIGGECLQLRHWTGRNEEI